MGPNGAPTLAPMSTNQSCTDCGAGLELVPDGLQCPHCGSDRRSVHLTATTASAMVMTGTLTVSIEYNPIGSWMEQWGRLLRHFDEIKDAYDKADRTDDLTDAVQQFFVTCWHLSDHICRDKTNLPTFDEGHFWNYLNTDPYLPVAQAFANTCKHLVRRKPSDPTAKVKRASI